MELLMVQYEDMSAALIGQTILKRENEDVQVLVYDGMEMVQILVTRDGMSVDEAYEFIDYNYSGAYLGKTNPVITWPVLDKKDTKEEENGRFH